MVEITDSQVKSNFRPKRVKYGRSAVNHFLKTVSFPLRDERSAPFALLGKKFGKTLEEGEPVSWGRVFLVMGVEAIV